jgi:hypothetical protein
MTQTEFDEQATDKNTALNNLTMAMLAYFNGDESMGVVGGYELAAAHYATADEIEQARISAKHYRDTADEMHTRSLTGLPGRVYALLEQGGARASRSGAYWIRCDANPLDVIDGQPVKCVYTSKVPTHTPGPWDVDDLFGDTHITAQRNGEPCNVVTGMYDEENEPTLEELAANARLIAAAPELLEKLGAILPYVESEVYALEKSKNDDESEAAAEQAAQEYIEACAVYNRLVEGR